MEHRHKDSALIYLSFAISLMLTFIPDFFGKSVKVYLYAAILIVLSCLSAYHWKKETSLQRLLDDILVYIMKVAIVIGTISFFLLSLKLLYSTATFPSQSTSTVKSFYSTVFYFHNGS